MEGTSRVEKRQLTSCSQERKVKEIQKEDGTKEERVIHFVRSFPVFNWEQTEGVPKKDAVTALDPDRDLIEVCDSILSRMPNPPAYRESGSSAYYMPKEDLVNLPPIEAFKTTEGYVATKFHEYGHATGHEARLGALASWPSQLLGAWITVSRSWLLS